MKTTVHLDDDDTSSNYPDRSSNYGRIYDDEDVAPASPHRQKKLYAMGAVIALMLIAGGLAAYFLLRDSSGDDNNLGPYVFVNVTQGTLRGPLISGTDVFMFGSVPFAAPPINEFRWLQPQPPKSWNGVRNATDLAPKCAQLGGSGVEDCLYLNIYTKQFNSTTGVLKNETAPVIVFIHGGSSMSGWSGDYDHTTLVQEENVVAVTINYRLNAFGYLALDVLTENSLAYTGRNSSGNYGIQDCIAALKWVKSNIQYFGGDASRVTVYGQSTGGTNVMALYISPHAVGQFDAAISLSGSPVLKGTLAEASKNNLDFLINSNCNKTSMNETRDCIYALSTEAVLKAIPDSWLHSYDLGIPSRLSPDPPLIIVDGDVITMELNAALVSGLGASVSLLYSHMAQENDFSPISIVSGYTQDNFTDWLRKYMPTLGWNSTQIDQIIALYPLVNYSNDAQLAYESFVTDITACGGRINLVHAAFAEAKPIFHLFNHYRPTSPVQVRPDWKETHAGHEWDLFLLLKKLPGGYSLTDTDNANIAQLRELFIHQFATSLTITDTKTWPPFNLAKFSGQGNSTWTLELKPDGAPTPVPDWNRGLCLSLFQLGFVDYGWAN